MYYDFLHRRVELVARLTASIQIAYDLWREIGYGLHEPEIPRHDLNRFKGVEVCASGIDLAPRGRFEPLPFGCRQLREVQIRWHNGAPLCCVSMVGVLYEQGADDVLSSYLSVWWPCWVAYLMDFDPKAPWNIGREYVVVDWPLPELPAELGINRDAHQRLIELLEQERKTHVS